jgi:hypothetical protein
MASQQGRRELGDRSVFLFHPTHPELPGQLHHRGYVAGRRATENDTGVIFSILLVRRSQHRYDAQRTAGPAGNFHRQGDHVESLIRKIA